MLTIREKIAAFWRDESGTETVEWAIVAAFLIVAAATAWGGLGGAVSNAINAIIDAINGAAGS
jgi:Flp pilus assembly pilin Flp